MLLVRGFLTWQFDHVTSNFHLDNAEHRHLVINELHLHNMQSEIMDEQQSYRN